MQQEITVLWLDDLRDPVRYLKHAPKDNTGALYLNRTFYDNFLKKYNPKFVWVKNFDEFVNYIQTNGLPDFISFDRDLKNGNGMQKGSEYPDGEDCAKWLLDYCKKNNLTLPKYYVHSANKNGRLNIPAILGNNIIESKRYVLTENDLRKIISNALTVLAENVYMKDVNSAKKKIGLKYQKGKENFSRGNINAQDKLRTDKMDSLNADTYIVKLKGGIDSYNITSIDGTAVMHYFKNVFDNIKTTVKYKDEKNRVEDYQLQMEDKEFNDFLNQFIAKVNVVINYAINNLSKTNKDINFSAVSIYPVPSSKKFNEKMAELMTRHELGGLPTRVVDSTILEKNLSTLKRDEDFINKNSDYYNGNFSVNGNNKMSGTVNQHVNKVINQYKKIYELGKYVDIYNQRLKELLYTYANYKSKVKRGENVGNVSLNTIVTTYKRLYNTLRFLYASSEYEDPTAKEGTSTMNLETFAEKKKYSKGPSTENRSNEIWNFVAPYIRGERVPTDGTPYKKMELVYLDKNKFEIKDLSNGERMGIKDYFSFSGDEEKVKNEIEKIKGTVLVVFDDNLSGGATLSDICYQFKKQGIEYIIPITFGKMDTKWQLNRIPLIQPKNEKGEVGKFNFQ